MNWFALVAAFVNLFVCAGCKARNSGEGRAPLTTLGSVPERAQQPSKRWDTLGCSERRLPNKYVDFEKFGEDRLESTEFMCAMARYLDGPNMPQEQVRHLAEVANRSGKWGAALFEYMAELGWEQFEEYISSRLRQLRREELIALCRSWREWSKGRGVKTHRLLRGVLYERALSDEDSEVRGCAIGFIARDAVSVSEAEALAERLSVEIEPENRSMILAAQIAHNQPATNRVVRALLRGPVERSVFEWICRFDLPDHNRYDFLPDLYDLRRRLEREKDVTKVESARAVLEAVNVGIAALEDLKRKGAPIAGAAPPTGAAP
jgi:hypothetical protein